MEKTWSGRNRSKYVSLDEGMRLIRKGSEETASGRIEHMETEIFAIDIEQLQI